jgi:hypothetical protein
MRYQRKPSREPTPAAAAADTQQAVGRRNRDRRREQVVEPVFGQMSRPEASFAAAITPAASDRLAPHRAQA